MALQPTFYALDVCTKTKVIPMPAGQIMGMVKKIGNNLPIRKPITMDVLVKATNNYLIEASVLN